MHVKIIKYMYIYIHVVYYVIKESFTSYKINSLLTNTHTVINEGRSLGTYTHTYGYEAAECFLEVTSIVAFIHTLAFVCKIRFRE